MTSKRREEQNFKARKERAEVFLGAEVRVKALPLTYEKPGRVWRSDWNGTPCLEWDCFGQDIAGYDEEKLARGDDTGLAPGSVLDKFIRLHDAQNRPEKIVEFAQEYGVLDLCEHQCACEHQRDLATVGNHCEHRHRRDYPCACKRETDWWDTGPGWWYKGCLDCEQEGRSEFGGESPREPLAGWVFYARQLFALLRVVTSVRLSHMDGNDQVKQEDLEAIWPPWWSTKVLLEGPDHQIRTVDVRRPETLTREERLSVALQGVDRLVEWWIDRTVSVGALELRAGFAARTGLELVLSVNSLPGLLARDLMAGVRSPLGWYYCDKCGYPYTPRWDPGQPEKTPRRPKKGHHKYCPECREGGRYTAVRRDLDHAAYREKHPEVKRRTKNSSPGTAYRRA